MRKNVWAAVISAIVMMAMVAVVFFAPTGFVARVPSEAVNLLDETLDPGPITLEGAVTTASGGTILMPSLSQTPPNRTITLPELMVAYLSADQGVLPRDSVYPPGQDEQEAQTASEAEADTQRTSATVTALREAGVNVTPMPFVLSIRQYGPANGRLEVGDFIQAVDGKPVTNKDELTTMVRAKSVGSPTVFTVIRTGKTLQITMNLVGSSTDGKVPTAGITPENGYFSWADVDIDTTLSQPGGSQGLSLALAVYTLVADEDILKGRFISAAGTITLDGQIGKVPGIAELAQSARLGGAEVFVVPWVSCPDLVGNYEDMKIVPATTFSDALWALRLDDPTSYPSCPPR